MDINYISTLKFSFLIITFILYSVIVIFDVTSFKIFAFEKVRNFVCPGGQLECTAGHTFRLYVLPVNMLAVLYETQSAVPITYIAVHKDIHVTLHQEHATEEQKV